MQEKENGPDIVRIAAIIYLVGTIIIVGISYVLPHSFFTATIVALAAWGIAVPAYIFLYIRRTR